MNNFQRVIYASRFMRVFGKFKRAQLREKPQRKIGPFCNPVKRLVRLKEKERLFCEIGLPRMIPRAKVRESEKLLEVIEAPKVKKEVLERRLEFLLSNESVYQQLYNKMYNGITPYQCELYMWERQMRDLRKVYRAQYLHKLSEVTNEEREKQLKLLLQTKEDKRKRRQEIRERILQDKKRRAILKDRLCLEKKVTQSILFKRQSNRKKKNIYWLMKLQQKSTYLNELDFKNKIEQTNQENDPLFNRNISVSSLYKNLGYQTKEDKNENTKVFKVDKVYRKLLEDSFEFLEEDEEQYEQNFVENINDPNHVSHKQRAHILYSSFTNEEKIKLLDDKIAILTKTIEQKSFSKEVQNNDLMFYIQLKDKLEASKQAFLEKNYLKDVQKVQ
ncbi:hypothetical protein CYL21_3619 [Plasmodium falciparum NF54]|uniref:Uncharacterized protein n=14 Tax=Plasmodium falciparum TaxID=5833 RepID=Q8IJS4_PLAF7|nr:conserved protein, unknown function [Plasmodium falciparum 3D7]KAF4327883.1 hypothetical protein CYL21_3619 [Plasmodium falciparum NF54]KOB87536.1 hypothetical protein PFDG_03426 [Plasmodium falciparum Dd2]PKC43576.1 hypothetical protein CK202_4798 [Plasmodium falciparum NF54]CZT98371.1 conserved protein, unknown function [Plasmodium falciparum 3D7]|eukprot:XP_001347403.1 conserved Plasmodium protein, unknown function [Plasmodium falciparum 3D7]